MKFFFIWAMLFKKCQSEGLQKTKKRGQGDDLQQKGCFLNKGGLNLHSMHSQENYEMEEFYFSLSHHYIIIHFFQFCLNDS